MKDGALAERIVERGGMVLELRRSLIVGHDSGRRWG